MGKRRDRRHAVLGGGGGRRMKLDLSNDDEVATAEDMNMNVRTAVEEGGEKAGVESDERLSPHALPGPVQVNPLSLLGQYSDEDEDEEKVLANGSSGGVPAVAVAGQVDEQVADFLADLETSGLLKDEVTHLENETESESAEQDSLPQELGTKGVEVLCDWESVLHKETSEYYYWNRVTGETTWEKPAAYASYESEVLKVRKFQNGLKKDSKHPLVEVTQSGSDAAHEASPQEAVSATNTALEQEAKNNTVSEDSIVIHFVETCHSKDVGSDSMSLEHAEKQDAARDSDDEKQIETIEGVLMIDSASGDTSKSNQEIRSYPEAIVIADAVEHVAEKSCQVETSEALHTVENAEGAEGLPAESYVSGITEDHPAAADVADASGSKILDPRNIPEPPKLYDYHRMLERGEILALKFNTLAGEALRCIPLRVRLAVELDVRLSDLKAMAMLDVVEDRFWEHLDSQITRLEALLLVEEAASSLEAEQRAVTSSFADGIDNSRPEADVHEAQGTQLQLAADAERNLKSTAHLRSEGEDMDVDMDLDMEPEDEMVVSTSAAATSVESDALGDSAVPHPLVYISTQTFPPLDSYGHVESQTPAQPLNSLPETPLFPSAPVFPSVDPVFPTGLSSFPFPPADSWVPPPPPEEEWAPPPLPDQEAPPPPPPEEDELPLASAPDLSIVDHPYSASVRPSAIFHLVGTNQFSLEVTGSERQEADSSILGVADVDTASVHVNGNALPPSVATAGAAEATTKKSSRGRNKKRSHSTAGGASLMSNKKVSTLVNKWLAAQEELHSSDEEAEDKDLFDVEALEKKRQREIDEWRHQTLASGGALENANFQPLGALNWRDRVKRARKEASKLAAKQEKDAKLDDVREDSTPALEESNLDTDKVVASAIPAKKPDLKELTKNLPPGWQAFWDAESSEVYYGNLSTSETSWDRPAV